MASQAASLGFTICSVSSGVWSLVSHGSLVCWSSRNFFGLRNKWYESLIRHGGRAGVDRCIKKFLDDIVGMCVMLVVRMVHVLDVRDSHLIRKIFDFKFEWLIPRIYELVKCWTYERNDPYTQWLKLCLDEFFFFEVL